MSDVSWGVVEDFSLSVPLCCWLAPLPLPLDANLTGVMSIWTWSSIAGKWLSTWSDRQSNSSLDTHCFNVHWGFPISRPPTVRDATYPPFTYCSRVHPNTSNTPRCCRLAWFSSTPSDSGNRDHTRTFNMTIVTPSESHIEHQSFHCADFFFPSFPIYIFSLSLLR